MVPKVTLADGAQIPAIGYGLGTANYGKDSADAVVLALKEGFTHLDGAEAYANDESVAVGLKKAGVPRESFWYTAKCSSEDPDAYLRKGLKTLGLDYVDLYLLHSPVQHESIGVAKAWQMCEQLQKEGLCRSIGVSNFRVKDLEELKKTAKVAPVINQVEVHPYLYKTVKPLIDYCKSNKIAIAAYGAQTPLTNAANGPVDEAVNAAATTTGKTPGQVLIKWAQQVGADVILTTSSKASRLQECKEAVSSMDPLSPEQVDSIIADGSRKHFRTFMHHMDD